MLTAAMKLRRLLLGRKGTDRTRHCIIAKQRHHFADKGLHSQSYGFSSSHVGTGGLDPNEGWVPKNGCFRIMVLEKTLRVPWTARSNQSTWKEINPEYSLEGPMLKLQHFGHLMWRANSLGKTLMLGKTERKRRRGWEMTGLDSITESTDRNLSKLWETVKDRGGWHAAVYADAESQTWVTNWTTTTKITQ